MSETVKETLQETAKEAVKSFIKTSDLFTEPIKQRMGHPFIGSFAISWILFNWKPIAYFIFTKSPIEFKIIYIEQNFCNWIFLFLAPFISACFYTVGLKWWDDISYRIVQKTIKTKNLNKKNEILTGIDHDIEIVKKQRILQNEKADNKEIRDLNSEIELLTKELEVRDEQIVGLNQSLLNSLSELKSLERESNDQQNKIVNLSLKLDDLKIESKENKKQLFSIVKEVMSPSQFKSAVEILQKTTSAFFNDIELNELLTESTNNYGKVYVILNKSEKLIKAILKSVQGIDPRIKINVTESKTVNGQNQVSINVSYPEQDMIEEIDVVIENFLNI